MSNDIIATVRVTHSDGKEERFLLRDQEELRIGREESNDIIIAEAGVSRFHTSLSASNSGVVVSDLASLNGSYINGTRLHGMRDLISQDVVQVGGAKIKVELAADDVTAASTGSVRARAMTAQMRPMSVSVLVVRLDVLHEDGASDTLISKWNKTVQEVVTEFDGKIDKCIKNVIVALWLGDDARNQALRAIRTYQKVSTATTQLQGDASVFAAVTSGLGLKGALGASSSGRDFNIVGDPVNSAFALAEQYSVGEARVVVDKLTSEHVSTVVTTISLDIDSEQQAVFTIDQGASRS